MSASKLTAYFLVRRMLKDGSLQCGPVERNVLLLLAGFADPDGSNIMQSYDSIRQVTGFSKSAVRRAIESWLRIGALILVKPGRHHDAPVYRLDLKIIASFPESAQGEHPQSAQEEHPKSAQGAPRVPQGALERHLPSLPINPTDKKEERTLAALAVASQVPSYLMAGRNRAIEEFSEEVYLALLDFERHRKKLHAPLTEKALELILKKLGQFRAQGMDPIRVIEQSIECGWRGLFPLRKESREQPKSFDERRREKSAAAINKVLGRFEEASRVAQRALPPGSK